MSKKQKIFLWIAGSVLAVIILSILYRLFWEFKNSDVKAFIAQEATKDPNPVQATKIITDSVLNILSSYSKTKGLRDFCAGTGISKEQALVTAAVKDANNMGYLPTTQPIAQ